MIKREISHYVLLDLINEHGKFGKLYHAMSKRSKKQYVLEIIKKDTIDSEAERYIRQDCNVRCNISSKTTLSFVNSFEEDNYFVIVNGNYYGYSLSTCLRLQLDNNGCPFSEQRVQYLMNLIINAISLLHGRFIIHRDLCLENIIVDFGGKEKMGKLDYRGAKVLIKGFGNSKWLEGNSLAQSVVQTNQINIDPMILFKEENELEGDLFYDNKADIWSLGTICFHLLVGSAPFDGQNKEIIEKIKKGLITIPFNLHLSKQCIAFVNSMLRFNPQDRVGIHLLSQDEFLTKDVDSFEKIELKRSELYSDIQIDINKSFSFGGLYDSSALNHSSHSGSKPKPKPMNNLTKEQNITECIMRIRQTIESIKYEVIANMKSWEYNHIEEDKSKSFTDDIDLTKSYFFQGGNHSSKNNHKDNIIQETIKEEKPNEVLISGGDPKEVKSRSSIRDRPKRDPKEKEKILQEAFNMINESSYKLGPLLVPFKPKIDNVVIPLDL